MTTKLKEESLIFSLLDVFKQKNVLFKNPSIKTGDNIMYHKCKVTVIQRGFNKEIVNSYTKNPENFSICDRVEDNQEFIISNPYEMPEGICASAWADLRPYILAIASGSTFDIMKEKNSALATCTDLFRPVIFKIEKIDE
ncbi:MAG: TIGR04076 family protein [Desulfobacteraceae bacterium]|nr:TIGR04076 family protein [Desulfobacteraceae bacterium]